MRNIYKISLIVLLVILNYSTITAQDETEKEKVRSAYQKLDASYMFGGQVFNDNFIYNPGFQIQATYGMFVNKDVAFGVGAGYKEHEEEYFVPIFIEAIGYKKNRSNTPFVKMQFGYSLAWDESQSKTEGYDYKGGIFIDFGMGRKIKLSNKYSVLFHWSYQHQFARMEYDIFNNDSYTQLLNYDMIVLSFGFIREIK